MNRPKPDAIKAALKAINEKDITPYAAARLYGVAQSSISRALKREAESCPCCGRNAPELYLK